MVTDAWSLFDQLQRTGSIPKARQPHDRSVEDLVENSVVTHMLADILTKEMPVTEVL